MDNRNTKSSSSHAAYSITFPRTRNPARSPHNCGHFSAHLDRNQRETAIRSINALYHAFLAFSPRDGGEFHASQTMLGDRANLCRQSVSKYAKVLIALGLVEVVEKHCAVPLQAPGAYRRYATVYRIARVNNHSLLRSRVCSDTEEGSRVIEKNLSKPRCGFDPTDSSIQKTNPDNTDSQDFYRLFSETDKVFRAMNKRIKARKPEILGNSLLKDLAEQDTPRPRIAVSPEDAPTFNVPQPDNRPRNSCGHKLRLTINRAGEHCGLVFWHCPQCRKTYRFRDVYDSHYDSHVKQTSISFPTLSPREEKEREEETLRIRRRNESERLERRRRMKGMRIVTARGVEVFDGKKFVLTREKFSQPSREFYALPVEREKPTEPPCEVAPDPYFLSAIESVVKQIAA